MCAFLYNISLVCCVVVNGQRGEARRYNDNQKSTITVHPRADGMPWDETLEDQALEMVRSAIQYECQQTAFPPPRSPNTLLLTNSRLNLGCRHCRGDGHHIGPSWERWATDALIQPDGVGIGCAYAFCNNISGIQMLCLIEYRHPVVQAFTSAPAPPAPDPAAAILASTQASVQAILPIATKDEPQSADSETTLGATPSPPVVVPEDAKERGLSASIVVLVVVVGLALCLAILVTVVKVSQRQEVEMMNSFAGSIATVNTVDDPYLNLSTLLGPTSSVLQSATKQGWLRSTAGSSVAHEWKPPIAFFP